MGDTVFIVGPPRSGTTLLYKALCLHPDVAYLSNWVQRYPALPTLAILNRLPPALPAMRRAAWFGDGANAYVYGTRRSALRRAFPAPVEAERVFKRCGIGATPGGRLPGRRPDLDELRRVFELVRRTGGGRVLVSKRIAHNLRIPLLATAFERARFLVVVRDGRAVADSLSRVDWWPDSRLWWRDTTPRAWVEQGGDPWTLCARHWVEELHALEDGLGRVPKEHQLLLRYEDLVADPHHHLRTAADFAGLSPRRAWEGELRRLRFPDRTSAWRSSLDRGASECITAIQRPLLVKYGYERQDDA